MRQNLSGHQAWQVLCRSGRKPTDIPASPHQVYRVQWTDWGDFLGTGRRHNIEWRPFREAREWARGLHLANQGAWRKFAKSPRRPPDIPTGPDGQYRGEWVSWGDWLGSGSIANQLRQFRSFEKARRWARKQRLPDVESWKRLAKSDSFPADIPKSPVRPFAKKWRGWGDWLGTGRIANQDRQFLPFSKARRWARSRHFASEQEWKQYYAQVGLPTGIPTNPNVAYKDEYQGYEDWLGIPRMKRRSRIEVALKYELLSVLGGDAQSRSIRVPGHRAIQVDVVIPERHLVIEYDGAWYHRGPRKEVKDKRIMRLLHRLGWLVVRVREAPLQPLSPNDCQVPAVQYVHQAGVHELVSQVLGHLADLGLCSRRVATSYRRRGRPVAEARWRDAIRSPWRPFTLARRWARKQRCANFAAWQELARRNRLPPDIPVDPWKTYGDEFASWPDWLGNRATPHDPAQWRPFTAARRWVRAQRLSGYAAWQKLAKTSKRPSDIPSDPYHVYADLWVDWYDWLGTDRSRRRNWRPFREARAWARRQHLHGERAWPKLGRRGKRPHDIPGNPRTVYVREWRGWDDWLGT